MARFLVYTCIFASFLYPTLGLASGPGCEGSFKEQTTTPKPELKNTEAKKNRSNMKLDGADFFKKNLSGYNFSGANLRGANFKGATITNTNFEGAKLEGADFTGAKLENTNFQKAELRETNFNSTIFKDSKFNGADATNAIFADAEFTKVDFTETMLERADLVRAKFDQVHFIQTNFYETDMRKADFASNVIFQEASFLRTNLNDANLGFVKLGGNTFNEPSLRRTNLEGVDFLGADLSQVHGLSAASLKTAFYDSATRFPVAREETEAYRFLKSRSLLPPNFNPYAREKTAVHHLLRVALVLPEKFDPEAHHMTEVRPPVVKTPYNVKIFHPKV